MCYVFFILWINLWIWRYRDPGESWIRVLIENSGAFIPVFNTERAYSYAQSCALQERWVGVILVTILQWISLSVY